MFNLGGDGHGLVSQIPSESGSLRTVEPSPHVLKSSVRHGIDGR